MQKKKIFITGIAGFIGYHFASYCLEMGYEVVGLDNFNDYYIVSLKRDRAKNLMAKGVQIIEADLSTEDIIKTIIEKEKVTHVVHLAAQAGVRYSFNHPEAYIHSNITGFLQVLQALTHFPEIPLVFASSSSVYGQNKKIPFSIEDRTDHQTNLYGVTKKTNELMAASHNYLHNITATGLRFFTVYGPWGRPDMAYFSFTKAILEGRTIDVYNDGNMLRDFTYIDDIVKGIFACLNIRSGFHLYNLGNNHPEPLMKLISLIEQELGKKAQIRFLPMQKGEIVETFADIKESLRDLEFLPSVSLDVGIPRFVSWYRSYFS